LWIVRSYQATYISASIKDVMVNTRMYTDTSSSNSSISSTLFSFKY
jgi:hypothetical protein